MTTSRANASVLLRQQHCTVECTHPALKDGQWVTLCGEHVCDWNMGVGGCALICEAPAGKDRIRVGREEEWRWRDSICVRIRICLLYLLKSQDSQAMTCPQSKIIYIIIYIMWPFRASSTQNLEIITPFRTEKPETEPPPCLS